MRLLSVIVIITFLALTGCHKEPVPQITKPQSQIGSGFHGDIDFRGHNNHCGVVVIEDFTAGQFIDIGNIAIENTANDLIISMATNSSWQINLTHIYVGDCNQIPRSGGGAPIPGQFPFNSGNLPAGTHLFTLTVPLSSLDSCFCILTHAEVEMLDSLGNPTGNTETAFGGDSTGTGTNRWFFFSFYCEQPCGPPPPGGGCDTGDFRTQTMGGWGAPPHGNNPGSYLHANFANCFPNGLVVGCNDTLTLTSAQAVTDFLPSGGKPRPLSGSVTDPTSKLGVLAGQLVAATLSVGFDDCDSTFGNSPNRLGDLTIASGLLQGFTVDQVIAAGNLILGGCVGNFAASEINEALDGINNNFTDGTIVGTFLNCP